MITGFPLPIGIKEAILISYYVGSIKKVKNEMESCFLLFLVYLRQCTLV